MQLFETIKIANKNIVYLSYHNLRFNRSRKALFGCNDFLDLGKFIPLAGLSDSVVYKCRVIYSKDIEKIEIAPYIANKIVTLRMVISETVDYPYKYADRSELEKLFSMKCGCDDIIIVKNNFITDSSRSNLIFFDGTGWVTPSTPLLPGIQRQFLLEAGVISQREIRIHDLKNLRAVKLINAMVDFKTANSIGIDNIY